MLILKENKVEFILAEFVVCLLSSSSSGYASGFLSSQVQEWVIQLLVALHVSPSPASTLGFYCDPWWTPVSPLGCTVSLLGKLCVCSPCP